MQCEVCCGHTIPLTCTRINSNTLEIVRTLYVYKLTQTHHSLPVGHFNTFTDTFSNTNRKHPGFYHLKTSLRRIAGASQTLSTTWHVPHPLILIFYICFSMLFHKVSAVSEVVSEKIWIHLFIEWSCFKHFYNAEFCFYICVGLGTVS